MNQESSKAAGDCQARIIPRNGLDLLGRLLTKMIGRKYCHGREKKSGGSAGLHPNDTFLIEEIIDDFDTLTHLGLSLIGHREDRSDELPRLHVFQRRDSVTGSGIEILSEAGQWEPPGKCLSALLSVFLRGVRSGEQNRRESIPHGFNLSGTQTIA